DADGDAALRCTFDRARDDRLRLALELEVVDRDVEALLRLSEVVRQEPRDVDRLLAAVGERADCDHAGIMNFAEVLRRRKMVRNYTDEPVERDAIDRIVAAGRKAPSGGFSQGVRFVVVTNQDTRGRIAELANEAEYGVA